LEDDELKKINATEKKKLFKKSYRKNKYKKKE
jgi:hypothetical protein